MSRPDSSELLPGRPSSGLRPPATRRPLLLGGLAALPRPRYSSYTWPKAAACLNADPDLFFPPEGERGPARDSRDLMALAVCAACPVLEECRRHALSARETYGIWGGTTEDQRRSFARRSAVPRTSRTPESSSG